MDIVRTYEKDGLLWAETSDGESLRWDPSKGRWDKMTRPRSPATDPAASPWSSSSLASAPTALKIDEQEPDPFSGNILDEAWNRQFPPFSRRRLVLGLALLPFMSLVIGVWRSIQSGEAFDWRQYLFTVVAGSLILIATFALNWKRDPESGSTPKSGIPDIDSIPSGWRVERSPAMTPLKEIGLSSFFFFIGMTGMMAFLDSSSMSLTMLAITAVGSTIIATLLHRRAWILLAGLLSALGGLVGAFFLTLWSMFMGGSDSLLVNWAICSGLLFLVALPFVWDIKRRAAVLQGRMRFPTWVIAGLTSVMMLLSGGLAASSVTDPSSEPQVKDVSAEQAWGNRGSHSPASSPQSAAQRLFSAWTSGDRRAADSYGAPDVVARLFSSPFTDQKFVGCGHLPGDPSVVCGIDGQGQLLIMKSTRTTEGFKVTEMRDAPAGTQLVPVPGAPNG